MLNSESFQNRRRVEGPEVTLTCEFCGAQMVVNIVMWPERESEDPDWSLIDLEQVHALCDSCSNKGFSLEMFGAVGVRDLPIVEEYYYGS